MSVADETGKALFVCFDEVMTKHHNMRAFEADHLLAGDGVNPEETQAPPFVERDRVLQPAFVDNLRFMECKGGDVYNGDDNPDAITVPSKVETGGPSQAQVASEKVKKARKA
ncbi:hypothetical protein YC2023_088829 [Brassica napus]